MKHIGAIVLVVGVLLLGYSGYEIYFKKGSIQQNLIPESECHVQTKVYEASDDHMTGVIENGQEFDVAMNWYKCHPIERGDVVLYKFSNSRDPVPRIVRGVPGDRFKLIRDKNRWNIEIDGDVLEADNGQPYFFGAEVSPVLSLYEKSSKGLLDADTLIVFSKNPPGGLDSGMFGAISVQDVIGKVNANTARAATGLAKREQEEAKAPPVTAEPAKEIPPVVEQTAADPEVAPVEPPPTKPKTSAVKPTTKAKKPASTATQKRKSIK